MNILKHVTVTTFAVLLAGCGIDSYKEYQAKVEPGAQCAFIYRGNDNATLAPLVNVFKDVAEKSFESEFTGDEKQEWDEFLENSGLKTSRVNWCVISVGKMDYSVLNANPDLRSLAMVANVKHKTRVVMKEMSGDSDDSLKIEVIEVAGVQAVKLTPAGENKNEGFEQYWTSLDNSLLIMAGSKAMLKTQIELYRDNAPGSSKFDSLLNDKSVIAKIAFADVGRLFKDLVKAGGGDMTMFDAFFNQIDYRSFGSFGLGVKVEATGTMMSVSELETASVKDAESVAALVKTALMSGIALIKQENSSNPDPELASAIEILNSLDVRAEGAKTVLSIPVTQKAVEMFADEIKKELDNQ